MTANRATAKNISANTICIYFFLLTMFMFAAKIPFVLLCNQAFIFILYQNELFVEVKLKALQREKLMEGENNWNANS